MLTPSCALSAGPLLLVEDDVVDQLVMRRACRELRIQDAVEVAATGEAALARLRDPGRARPRLILLDLHLPTLSGAELLALLARDPALAAIPVVVLAPPPPSGARGLFSGVAGWLPKVLDYRAFVAALATLPALWAFLEAA